MPDTVAIDRPEWVEALGKPVHRSWVFSDGNANHGQSLVARSPRKVLPGLFSFSEEMIRFQRAFRDGLNDTLPVQIDEKTLTVGANGIHRPFDQICTVSGYPASPMSFTPVSNEPFADELGLPSDFKSPRHREIFDALWDKVFAAWVARSLKTPNYSTFGAPLWVPDARTKRDYALWFFQPTVLESALASLDGGDRLALARDFGVTFLMNIGRRDQVDTVGKIRWVFPREYALTSGQKGAPQQADKTVKLPGIGVVPDFSATRARVYHGGPYSANVILQAVATGHLYALFASMPEIFHHTDIDAKCRAIPAGHKISCSDITEYDRSMRSFLLNRMLERAAIRWDPRVVGWARQMLYAAYYTRPLEVPKPDIRQHGTMVGDWRVAGDQVVTGNRSGHAWTSLIAKVMRVFDDLATIDDVTHDVVEQFDRYCRNQMPLKIWNNGDDGLIHGPADLMRIYTTHRYGKVNPGYFVSEPEVGQVFSGKLIQPSMDGYRAIPRLHTTAEKIYVPERSIGGNFRSRWTIGIITRFNPEQYSNEPIHPSHDAFLHCHQKAWRDVLQPKFGDFMDLIRREHELLDISLDGLTPIDIEVLNDPDKLHYRYTEDDVSPVVLNMLFGKNLMPEEYTSIQSYYNGQIG